MISKPVWGQAKGHSEAWGDLLSGTGDGGEIKPSGVSIFRRLARCRELTGCAAFVVSHNLSAPRVSGIVSRKEGSASHFHRQALFIAD